LWAVVFDVCAKVLIQFEYDLPLGSCIPSKAFDCFVLCPMIDIKSNAIK
jgi:hypothetical protein